MAMRRSEKENVPGEVARQIDENLKRLYGPSAEDELPQELQQLIASLRAGETSSDTGAESQ